MSIFDSFMGLLSVLLNSISTYQNNQQQKSKMLSSIKLAVRLTKNHIDLTRHDDVDVDSAELVHLWSKSAELIRPFNRNTADIFESKSDYWINPTGFKMDINTGEKRFDFRMRLSEVEKLVEEIERSLR